jgi:hypothetical protein
MLGGSRVGGTSGTLAQQHQSNGEMETARAVASLQQQQYQHAQNTMVMTSAQYQQQQQQASFANHTGLQSATPRRVVVAYACSVCGAHYNDLNHLQAHVMNVHQKQAKFMPPPVHQQPLSSPAVVRQSPNVRTATTSSVKNTTGTGMSSLLFSWLAIIVMCVLTESLTYACRVCGQGQFPTYNDCAEHVHTVHNCAPFGNVFRTLGIQDVSF